MTQYEIRFIELTLHDIFLIPTEKERVRRLIEGLNFGV